MKTLTQRIQVLPWDQINTDLLENGFVVIPKVLTAAECVQINRLYDQDELYRSTIDMKRYNFGQGTYRYFRYPLLITGPKN